MTEVLVILFACSLIAAFYTFTVRQARFEGNYALGIPWRRTPVLGKFLFLSLVLTLVCFSGLRSRMNDTETYINTFSSRVPSSLDAISEIDWSVGRNPLFVVYQILIRTFVSSNAHVFLFLTSMFITTSFLLFIYRYSADFGFSVFIYIAFTSYAFTMGAMKQSIAAAMAIWTVPLFLKKHYFKAFFLIFAAMLFHPYVVIFLLVPLLTKGIWDGHTLLLLLLTVAGVALYGTVIVRVLSLTASIGDDYDITLFTQGNTVNVFRFFFYLIVPLLSFIYRRQLRRMNSHFANVSINLCVVSACVMVFARIGDANMFGRMASYFDVFQCLAIGYIFTNGVKGTNVGLLFKFVLIPCYCFFYFTYYQKYVSAWEIGWDGCVYRHISLMELFMGW